MITSVTGERVTLITTSSFMRRYFFTISYLGTRFAGWQRQPNVLTVEEEIETWLERLYGFPIELFGSGRTDAGVHASGQVAHADLPDGEMTDMLLRKLNRVLPEDIAVTAITEVQPHAHARHDGIARKYRYRMHFHRDPFLIHTSAQIWRKPELELMELATPLLLGQQSFRSLSKTLPDNYHYLCNVQQAYWIQTEVGLEFHIKANRFLQGMVRATVGALLKIGQGEKNPEWLGELIQQEGIALQASLAPPHGLYLEEVVYKPEVYLQ